MATFTALYKMRIFNFEDVMRDEFVSCRNIHGHIPMAIAEGSETD